MAPVASRAPPRWPSLVLAACALLAAFSLLQGVVDVALPALRGEEPFGFLFAATRAFGPAFFAAYVFVHNLGLACVVPGFGFVAARFERQTRNRRWIGLLLLGAVVASLFVAFQYLVQASHRFDPLVAFPLFLGEALAVLWLAHSGARELKGFVPTRVYDWSLVTPLRRLRAPLVGATVALAALSVVEAALVLG